MSQDPWHSVEQLARRYQDVANGRAHPGPESDQSEPEPIGWRSGARETYRRCAADLRQVVEELRRDEEARQFAASGLVVAASGAPWMPLELRRGLSEARHYLDGRAVRRGDFLELLLLGGRVLRGRYEWDSEGGDPLERSPALVIEVAGGTWGKGDAFLLLPPEARLRWPPEAARGQSARPTLGRIAEAAPALLAEVGAPYIGVFSAKRSESWAFQPDPCSNLVHAPRIEEVSAAFTERVAHGRWGGAVELRHGIPAGRILVVTIAAAIHALAQYAVA